MFCCRLSFGLARKGRLYSTMCCYDVGGSSEGVCTCVHVRGLPPYALVEVGLRPTVYARGAIPVHVLVISCGEGEIF